MRASLTIEAGQGSPPVWELEPDRPITLHNFAFMLSAQGRLDSALVWCDSTLAVDPDYGFTLLWRVRALSSLGRAAEARRDADRLDLIAPGSLVAALARAQVDAAAGDTAAARRQAHLAMALVRDTLAPTPLVASFVMPALVALGDREWALAFLERVRPRAGRLWAYLRGTVTDALKDEPRFRRIMDEARPPGVSER